MEPEISRRCPQCGASVRGNASFCPQCGRTLKAAAGAGAGSSSSSSSPTELPETPARRITDPGRNAPTINQEELSAGATSASTVPGATTAPEGSLTGGGVAGGDNRLRAEVPATRVAGDTVEDEAAALSRRQRMTTAARDAVEEKLSPRVEKLRHASTAVLGEAAYDPSLRFVLVAVIILVLSLLLLLLNYLIG